MPAPPRNLVLVRHCRAAGQEPEAWLTDEGLAQAEELSRFLSDREIDFLAASGFRRARQSLEPYAAKAALPIHIDRRFNERTLSAEPLENWQAVVRDSFDDHDLRAPGGESAREVLHRAWAGLDEVLGGGHALPLIVTHGNLMALVLHSLDPAFGYEGWKSLTNPDVYLLREENPGAWSFERLWPA